MKIPVRIDLLGGWSDQLCWPYEAAVLNASVGWGQPPLTYDGKFHSTIEGVGTGLGISSIKAAAEFLSENPKGDYIKAALDWETENGTQGGWQDQIGAIEPGIKLITSSDHKKISWTNRDDHPIFNHIVLFDTQVRRSSKVIGDMVRELIGTRYFDYALKTNVMNAHKAFHAEAEECAQLCIEGFQRLDKYVPMDIGVPVFKECWGHKLLGAGGGGFGIYFVKDPDDRITICQKLPWAVIPELMGVEYD